MAALAALAALCSPFRLSAADRTFTTSPTQAAETQLVVQMLERYAYDRDTVHGSDYTEVIPDYMSKLDGQHLFFLAGDKARFEKQSGSAVYANAAYLGNIDLAYQIFNVYQERATARATWIFAELKKDFDFTKNETFAFDRSKAEWPQTQADADDLWRRRIKFELLGEMLNKKTLDQAREVVRKRYERMLKNMADIDGGDLAELYLTTITGLYDPHSEYFSADTFEDFGIQMKLQLVGIGAMLRLEDDYCTVEDLVPGGPAELGHQLRPKDKIVAVAGDGEEPVEVIGMKLPRIVHLIRGPKGTRVHLWVEHANATDASARKEVIITRDVVKLNSSRAHAATFQVPGADGKPVTLGVIALPEFYGPSDDPTAEKTSASQDVARLIGELKQAGIKGLVLDLRHNGGGYLTEAINLAGLFINRGPVVQVKSSLGDVQVDSDDEKGVAYDGPMAVLVDRFSASASEIVAGALQNYGRAIVVGDTSTHGKGTVQTVLELKNFSRELASSPAKTGAAKITVQKFYLPNGSSTQLRGVVSDIALPSIDEYLPIGESSLPHALIWDHIASSKFDGQLIDPKLLATLRKDSQERQAHLEEFAYLRRIVDWFKGREELKVISLNADERRRMKTEDDTFRKAVAAEHDKLEKNEYAMTEYRLGPPPPPKAKVQSTDAASPNDSDNPDGIDQDDVLSTDEDPQMFQKVDVHLRETLRILSDAIDLGRDRSYWASNHAPLTVAEKG